VVAGFGGVQQRRTAGKGYRRAGQQDGDGSQKTTP